jgi:predicted SAM-dependent methyltransferase
MVEETKPLVKYNLACGQNRLDGFINIDIIKTDQTDIVMDLEIYPWEIADNSVDEIMVSHYIEHVSDLMKFVDELYRITKKGSKITVIAPYYTSVRAWQDPTHKHAISEMTFLYFNKGWREQNRLTHYPIKADFDFSYGYVMYPEFASRVEDYRAFAMKHYWNVISDIQVNLTRRD